MGRVFIFLFLFFSFLFQVLPKSSHPVSLCIPRWVARPVWHNTLDMYHDWLPYSELSLHVWTELAFSRGFRISWTGKVWAAASTMQKALTPTAKNKTKPVRRPQSPCPPVRNALAPAKGTGLIDSPLHHVKTKSPLSDRCVETGMERQIGFSRTPFIAAQIELLKKIPLSWSVPPSRRPHLLLRSPPALLMVPTLGWMCPLCAGSQRVGWWPRAAASLMFIRDHG